MITSLKDSSYLNHYRLSSLIIFILSKIKHNVKIITWITLKNIFNIAPTPNSGEAPYNGITKASKIMNWSRLCGQYKKPQCRKIVILSGLASPFQFLAKYARDCNNRYNDQSSLLPRIMKAVYDGKYILS